MTHHVARRGCGSNLSFTCTSFSDKFIRLAAVDYVGVWLGNGGHLMCVWFLHDRVFFHHFGMFGSVAVELGQN